MGILHEFSNRIRATLIHGHSPSEGDWGDPKGEPTKHQPSLMEADRGRKILNYTSSGCMLMDVDWGGNLRIISWKEQTKHNYTSIGPMFMEVDWAGKLKLNCTSCRCSMVDWQAHGIHPTGDSISEVDWGGHDSSPNHMNEFLFSEVDWGAHDSSLFLFLVNIDYDANPKEIFIQGLWRELQQRTSSTPLIGLLIDFLATGQTEDVFSTPYQLNLIWMTLNNLLVSPFSTISPW